MILIKNSNDDDNNHHNENNNNNNDGNTTKNNKNNTNQINHKQNIKKALEPFYPKNHKVKAAESPIPATQSAESSHTRKKMTL